MLCLGCGLPFVRSQAMGSPYATTVFNGMTTSPTRSPISVSVHPITTADHHRSIRWTVPGPKRVAVNQATGQLIATCANSQTVVLAADPAGDGPVSTLYTGGSICAVGSVAINSTDNTVDMGCDSGNSFGVVALQSGAGCNVRSAAGSLMRTFRPRQAP